jgi:uncharacterized protein (TIGR00299 family) protein
LKIAYFDASSGVSGDMTLGALVELGWPFETLAALPARLGLDGVTIASEDARRGPFRGRRIDVRVSGAQPHRHLKDVRAILARADVPAAVRDDAEAVFTRLAEAEAAVHGSTTERVHFHEVGAADALIDIVGACLGRHELAIERVYATPIVVGSGTVTAEHGTLPVPAPATARLLQGARIDWTALEGERATPTGAALLATWVSDWSEPPPFRLLAQGVGAGARDPKDRPNVLRVFLGETEGPVTRREVCVLECAIDDEQPQAVAHATQRLLEAGARDAFVTPIVMKKGRSAVLLTVLCDPDRTEALVALVFAHTSTIGLRIRRDERRELPREEAVVRVFGAEMRLKVVTLPDGSRRARPEHDDVAAVAQSSGKSFADVSAEAMRAFAASVSAPR